MPMSKSFEKRLYPVLPGIVAHFGTPFHIYDETGIRQTGQALLQAFRQLQGFREYFAVKALPNVRILQIMQELGFGFDCSSIAELVLSRRIGASGDAIMFSSNNTTIAEFEAAAADGGSILNLDDISLVDKVPVMPERISVRYNPGPRRSGNCIIGHPAESKFGVAHAQILDAYRAARARGARLFGLHTMLISNERDHRNIVRTTKMLLELAEWIGRELGIAFEFINIGGGLGIPYRPEESSLDLAALARGVVEKFGDFNAPNGYVPALYMESGRYMTGPHGVLVVSAINRKEIYRTHIGVDASMSALMRPAIYGAYHHISVPGKRAGVAVERVDVVGSLCENNDKFALQRDLPHIEDGDILCIHDTGAHGHAMGFNYNGRLRPKELLLCSDGSVELIRREERLDDYFATMKFSPRRWVPEAVSAKGAQNYN